MEIFANIDIVAFDFIFANTQYMTLSLWDIYAFGHSRAHSSLTSSHLFLKIWIIRHTILFHETSA